MDKEKSNFRDLTYSAWHRYHSTKKLLSDPAQADLLNYIDIDSCEYCALCHTPLFLAEITEGGPSKLKPFEVTRRLANMAGIPAYLVRYKKRGNRIEAFWVQNVTDDKPGPIIEFNPEGYARFLLGLHLKCKCEWTRALVKRKCWHV